MKVENKKGGGKEGEREAEAHRNPCSGLHLCGRSPGISIHTCLPDEPLSFCVTAFVAFLLL